MSIAQGNRKRDLADDRLQLVCVSHRPELFARHIRGNENVNGYAISLYDNTVENVGIAERYNHFIENAMGDEWVVFMHHDMCFHEDPLPSIQRLPRTSIYGVIGTSLSKGRRWAFVGPSRKRGLVAQYGRFAVPRMVGRIKCDPRIAPGETIGEYDTGLPRVDTVDCCCLIVHSSLIRRYDLRFDPRFAWHFYSEDFSLNATTRYGIDTRVVQLYCGHYGLGDLNADFYQSQNDLVQKYDKLQFSSTCYFPPAARGIEQFAGRRGLLIQF